MDVQEMVSSQECKCMHSGVLKESYRYPSSKAPFFHEKSWFLKVLKRN
jgi:hypothetical protein